MKSRRRRATTRPRGRTTGHVTRDGRPKVAYRTSAEAQQAAQLAWTLHGANLETYRCDVCHQWHMGTRFREN